MIGMIKLKMMQHRMDRFKLDYCQFLTKEESSILFDELEKHISKGNGRKATLYGDDIFYQVQTQYTYGEYQPLPWLPCLMDIKLKLEQFIKTQYDMMVTFNCCVVQRYSSGRVVIKAHRDKEMTEGTMICGISLGQKRTLTMYKYKTPILSQPLDHGSLYLLLPPTNDFFAHSIPTDDSKQVRISLTFRNKK